MAVFELRVNVYYPVRGNFIKNGEDPSIIRARISALITDADNGGVEKLC